MKLTGIMLERSVIFVNNVKRRMQMNGIINQAELSKITGIRETTLSNWMCHNTYPGPENLVILANAFNCSVADLTEDETYLDERRRYLTVGQASLLQAYANDRQFQQICDVCVKLMREKRFYAYASSILRFLGVSENKE